MRNPFDLNDVRRFVAAAQAGTLSKAAEELNQPASTISRALTRLEKHLGVTLLRRSFRGLALTDDGREYLLSCRRSLRMLRDGEELLHTRRSQPRGLLKVGCPVTMARDVLAPLIPDFTKRFPDLRLEIEPYASGWDREPREDIDVFFKLRAPRDSVRRIRTYPGAVRGLFASPAYLKTAGVPAEPNHLPLHRCAGSGVWKLTRGNKVATPEITFHIVTSDPYVHLQFVCDGLGIAILPLFLARRAENRKKLSPILALWNPEPITVCALFNGPSRLTPKVQALLDFLSEYMGTDRDPRINTQGAMGFFTDPSLPATSGP
jgi:DNA-binding transcriptional LysR family regulator